MKVSMVGRGHAKDNIWIEKFWNKIKYEYIYIKPEENSTDLFFGIKRFIDDFNYTVVTKESTVQYQASSTFVRQLGLS